MLKTAAHYYKTEGAHRQQTRFRQMKHWRQIETQHLRQIKSRRNNLTKQIPWANCECAKHIKGKLHVKPNCGKTKIKRKSQNNPWKRWKQQLSWKEIQQKSCKPHCEIATITSWSWKLKSKEVTPHHVVGPGDSLLSMNFRRQGMQHKHFATSNLLFSKQKPGTHFFFFQVSGFLAKADVRALCGGGWRANAPSWFRRYLPSKVCG